MLAGAAAVAWLGGSGHPATSPLMVYQCRALVVVLVLLATGAWWWSDRRGSTWGYEAVPAVAGAIAALALTGALAGTPFAPGGLGGDQTFRTAAVTRFADDWRSADFTVDHVPAAYPPAYFWGLGRIAALTGTEPWRMLKVGAILSALAVPTVAFSMWRRIVPARVASLISVVPLVVENFYEPYAWLVLAAFVPWWVGLVGTSGRRAGGHSALALGAIGALLLATYYYFLLVGVVAVVVHLVSDRLTRGTLDRAGLRRLGIVCGVTAIMSAPFWLPLLISIVRADQPESLANRWFAEHHGSVPLPMLDATPAGLLMLVGLVHLLWSVGRNELSRLLLVLLGATYVWYLLGAVAAITDHPLLSFRAKPLVPTVLACAGVRALVEVSSCAAARFDRRDVRRVTVALATLVGISFAQQFVTTVRTSTLTAAARDAARPDRSPPAPSAAELQASIERRVGPRATLVSDRVDILVFYPNHAFVPWDAHYAHPAAEFTERVDFLQRLAAIDDPSRFASASVDSRFGRIDAFVLRVDGDDLVFRFIDDAFPAGVRSSEVRFGRAQFDAFDVVTHGDHVVATRTLAPVEPERAQAPG